jgi:NADPH2 dehydrogenase
MDYPHLLKPFVLGRTVTLPNRLVMPPLVLWKGGEDGSVTPYVLEHYRRTAGPGLTVVEATVVSPEGRLARTQLGIFEDRHVEGLAKIVDIIHSRGAFASIQIHHAGRSTNLDNTFGSPLVAPSAIAARDIVPQELTEEGIERILTCFGAAAGRAAQAGFDALEVHGAHGYLASQFLSPLANQRTDSWGGSLENRARFVREAARRARGASGGRLLVSVRLGVADGLREDGQQGLPLEQGIQVARWLEEDGVDFLDISSGIGNAPPIAPPGSPWSDRMHLAIEVKKKVKVPVIGVGGITDMAQAEGILAEGSVDLVAVGKAMLADPDWAIKSLGGGEDQISRCRQCKICHHFGGHVDRCPARKLTEGRGRGAA